MVSPMHYLLDAKCAKGLDDVVVVEAFVREVVDRLGLHIVKRTDGSEVIDSLSFEEDKNLPSDDQFGAGVSCLALISESNIAVHTRTLEQKINIDVFSCRGFPTDEIYSVIDRYFEVQQIERQQILSR